MNELIINYKPFYHVYVKNIFTNKQLLKLCEYIKTTNWIPYTSYPYRFSSPFPSFILKSILEIINRVIAVFPNFNISNGNHWEITLCKDVPPYSIGSHTDTLDKLITIIIYIKGNLKDGTMLWNKATFFESNSLLAFEPSSDTYHSVNPITSNRYTIQINYRNINTHKPKLMNKNTLILKSFVN